MPWTDLASWLPRCNTDHRCLSFSCHLEIYCRPLSSPIAFSGSQFNCHTHTVLPSSLCLYLPLTSKTRVVFSSEAIYWKPCGSHFKWKSLSTLHQCMSKGLPKRNLSMVATVLLSTRLKRAPGMYGVWPTASSLHTLQFSCPEIPISQSEPLIRNTGRWSSLKSI